MISPIPHPQLPELPPRRHSPLHDPVDVYLAGQAESTRATVLRSLRRVAALAGAPSVEAVPWESLRYPHLQAIKGKLLEHRRDPDDPKSGLSHNTINLALTHLRGVARASWSLGYMGTEEWERVKEIRLVGGHRLPAGRAVASGELAALLEACGEDPTAAGARDAALVALLYGTGVRRSELAGLDLGDYDPATGELTVRQGKGRKDRTVWVTGGAAAALDDWLGVRGDAPGPVFCPVNKGGRVRVARLRSEAVYEALRKRARQARLARGLSPHDMRRSFISDMLDRGADIVTVQHLAGHADVSTTARYDRRGEATKRRASELLHVPYERRREGGRG